MDLFIDCEWSEDKQLISMALVPYSGATSFYKAVTCDNPGEWQAEHVIPVLDVEPVDYALPVIKVYLPQYAEAAEVLRILDKLSTMFNRDDCRSCFVTKLYLSYRFSAEHRMFTDTDTFG